VVVCLERGADCLHCLHCPADATVIPKPHRLLPYLNPYWFYFFGTGLPRLSWKRGRETGVLVLVVVLREEALVSMSLVSEARALCASSYT